MGQTAGEQELRSSVETRRLHHGSAGRIAGRSGSVGREAREEGRIAVWLDFCPTKTQQNTRMFKKKCYQINLHSEMQKHQPIILYQVSQA